MNNDTDILNSFEQQTLSSYQSGQMNGGTSVLTRMPNTAHVAPEASHAPVAQQSPTGLFNDPIVSSRQPTVPVPTGPTIKTHPPAPPAPTTPAMDPNLIATLQQLSDRLARLESNGHAPVHTPPAPAAHAQLPVALPQDDAQPADNGRGPFKFASADDVGVVWKLAGRAKKEHPDVIRKRVIMLARKQGFALPKAAIQWLTDLSTGGQKLAMPFERRAHHMAAFMRSAAEFSSFLQDDDRRGAFEGMVQEQMAAWLSDPEAIGESGGFFFTEEDEKQDFATADAEIAALLSIAQYILEEEGYTAEEAEEIVKDMTPGVPQGFAEKKAQDSDGEPEPMMFEFELEDLTAEELKELEEQLGDKFEKFALQLLASRTKKGNVTAEERKKSATLSKGRFPIFDKKSAKAALKLRGHAKSASERSKIISRAAKFAPEEAKKAREADKKQKNADSTQSMMSLAEAIARETGGTADEVFSDLFARSALAKGDKA